MFPDAPSSKSMTRHTSLKIYGQDFQMSHGQLTQRYHTSKRANLATPTSRTSLPMPQMCSTTIPRLAQRYVTSKRMHVFRTLTSLQIHGVDLANLSDAQKNDLARLIATRGVVFFRNQKNLGIDEQRELGKYFGELHKHATTGVPKREGLEDVHVIFTGEGSPDLRSLFSPTFLWHSDVSPRTSHMKL